MLGRLMNFQGRIGRRSYALAQIPILVVAVPFYLMCLRINKDPNMLLGPNAGPLLGTFFLLLLAMLPLSWFSYSQVAKRFHDLDRSAWFSLVFLVPVVSWAAFVYVLFARGEPGENRFGHPDNG
jgi:uncharacterized membrane protein YhaH (DUF805 family)